MHEKRRETSGPAGRRPSASIIGGHGYRDRRQGVEVRGRHPGHEVPRPADGPGVAFDQLVEERPAARAAAGTTGAVSRAELDHVAQDGDRGIDVRWLAPDPAGTWVVSYVSRPDEQGRVMVFLENPARSDGPD